MNTHAQQQRLAVNDLMVVLAKFPVRRLIILMKRILQQRVVRGAYSQGENGCLLWWLSDGTISSREERIRYCRQPTWAQCTSRLVDSWDGRLDAPYSLDSELILRVVRTEVRRRLRLLRVLRIPTQQFYYKPGVVRHASV